MKQVHKAKESVAVTGNESKMALNKVEKSLEQEELNILALWWEFKQIEQELKEIPPKK